MDLRARLRALESRLGVGGSARAATEAARPPAPIPLVARLQRLAVAQSERRARRIVTPAEIARLVGGERCADGVVVIDNVVPLAHCHGRVPLRRICDAALDFVSGGGEPERERLLFIDTETTGLAGGTGTVAFVLGLARIRNHALEIRQYFLSAFGGEAAMLAHALEWIAPGSHLVSFNGKSFDAPLLATRYRLALLGNPLAGLSHIDLLHRTRTAFKRNWPDCRLQTAEQHLLKLHRSDDVPGHLIPQIWTDWLQYGETGGLRGVIEHNRIDLLSLVALAGVLGNAYANPGCENADPLALSRAHRRAGDARMAQRHLEECAAGLTDAARFELAGLYARAAHWDKALLLWESLADRNDWRAMEKLAIYHEHRKRDYDSALEWTERIRSLAIASDAVEKRHARLVRRRALRGAAAAANKAPRAA